MELGTRLNFELVLNRCSVTSVIDARYSDSMGFNYLQFLKAVQPPEQLDDVYSTRITGIMSKDEVSLSFQI